MRKALLSLLFFSIIPLFPLKAQLDFFDRVVFAWDYYRKGDFHTAVREFDTIRVKGGSFNGIIVVPIQKALEGDTIARAFLKLYEKEATMTGPVVKPVNFYLDAISKSKPGNTLQLLVELCESDTTAYGPIFSLATYFYLKEKGLSEKEGAELRKKILQQNARLSFIDKQRQISQKNYLDFIIANEDWKNGLNSYDAVLGFKFQPLEINELRSQPLFFEKDFYPLPSSLSKQIIDRELKDHNKKELLEYACSVVMAEPTKVNFNWLKATFKGAEVMTFWHQYQNNLWSAFTAPQRIRHYIDSLGKDKWIVLDIWGPWCEPCVAEMPEWAEMDDLMGQMEEQQIDFLTLCLDPKNKAPEFMEENNYHFPYLLVKSDEMKAMGVFGYPTTYLINPEGKTVIFPFGNFSKVEAAAVYSGLEW